MVPFHGRPLLHHAVATLRGAGATEVVVVRGDRSGLVSVEGAQYVDNTRGLNMVYSLMCAEEYLEGDVVVSYADIVYEPRLVDALLCAPAAPVSVVIDTDWRRYFQLRASDPMSIAESLVLDEDRIMEVGQPVSKSSTVDGQYIGLMRFSAQGCAILREIYRELLASHSGRHWRNADSFESAYMTDLLQELIDRGVLVRAVPVKGGWLEFDTRVDYELATDPAQAGRLRGHFDADSLPSLRDE
jgi:L-glutamine-phosphate cytidylyltransferase